MDTEGASQRQIRILSQWFPTHPRQAIKTFRPLQAGTRMGMSPLASSTQDKQPSGWGQPMVTGITSTNWLGPETLLHGWISIQMTERADYRGSSHLMAQTTDSVFSTTRPATGSKCKSSWMGCRQFLMSSLLRLLQTR